jgi:hypothetical protein
MEQLELMLAQGGDTTEPSESLLSHLHRCPIDQVVPLLKRLMRHPTDPWTQGRAFECLMQLAGFDQVAFLASTLRTEPDEY